MIMISHFSYSLFVCVCVTFFLEGTIFHCCPNFSGYWIYSWMAFNILILLLHWINCMWNEKKTKKIPGVYDTMTMMVMTMIFLISSSFTSTIIILIRFDIITWMNIRYQKWFGWPFICQLLVWNPNSFFCLAYKQQSDIDQMDKIFF